MKGQATGWPSVPLMTTGTLSLSITDANGTVLVCCQAGCSQQSVIGALQARGLWTEKRERSKLGPPIKTYEYHDSAGRVRYQITRHPPTDDEPKPFRPSYLDEANNRIWKKHPDQILYHLPDVLKAHIVFVVEGEKDADTLREHGLIGTTNAGGAKAPWLPQFTDALKGKEVILIPDNDPPGRMRVARIARALVGKVSRLLVLELSAGKDVTDWFEAGHSETELLELVSRPEVVQ